MTKGFLAADLYLLVGGVVRCTTREKLVKESTTGSSAVEDWESEKTDSVHGGGANDSIRGGNTYPSSSSSSFTKTAGDFINEIGFFTDSPQMETVRTKTVCKTLTLSRTAYRMLCEDYPESIGTLLQNLLAKVRRMAQEEAAPPTKAVATAPTTTTTTSTTTTASTSTSSATESDGTSKSVRFEQSETPDEDGPQTQRQFQLQAAEATVEDLIQMHVNKIKDDRTTRFLFAASRGDLSTLHIMLNQGMDPNSSDYDRRTGLMVAAMKGQTEVVVKLLEFNANPNMVDMHGTSALREAAMNGHEEALQVLLDHDATLCLSESQAASVLCQAVFDGDVMRLRHLIRAGIQVNAGDYDRRTGVHIAAAEGNLAALKVLVEEGGASLEVKDRWNNSVMDEAKASNSGKVVEYLSAHDLASKYIRNNNLPHAACCA